MTDTKDKLHLFAFNLETHYCDTTRGVDIVIGADYGTAECSLPEVSKKMRALTTSAKADAIEHGFKLQNLSFTFTFFNRID